MVPRRMGLKFDISIKIKNKNKEKRREQFFFQTYIESSTPGPQ